MNRIKIYTVPFEFVPFVSWVSYLHYRLLQFVMLWTVTAIHVHVPCTGLHVHHRVMDAFFINKWGFILETNNEFLHHADECSYVTTNYLLLPLQSGRSPLMEASMHGHNNCVDLLLQSGANVNLQDKVCKVWNQFFSRPHQISLWCLILLLYKASVIVQWCDIF